MFARKDAWELLEKGTFTVAASEATAANAQAGGMPKALQMANPALVSAFALNAGTTAARTDWRPLFRGLKVYLKTIPLSCFAENLITSYSNGFKDARHTGILSPMSPIFDQEPHGGDFAPPTVEGFSQSLHRSKLLGFVLLDVGQEPRNELFGPRNGLVLFI